MVIKDRIARAPDNADLENLKVQQIIAAATKLFLAQGYDACSMDAVSRTAKVSKATLYAHFVNKETLFAALIREEVKAVTERLRPPTLDQMDLESSLHQIANQFVNLYLSKRGIEMHRLIFAEAARFPKIRRVFAEWGPQRLRRMISELLLDAKTKGLIDLPDPDLGAIHFVSLISGDLPMQQQLGLAPPPAKEIQRMVQSAISLFLKGCSAK